MLRRLHVQVLFRLCSICRCNSSHVKESRDVQKCATKPCSPRHTCQPSMSWVMEHDPRTTYNPGSVDANICPQCMQDWKERPPWAARGGWAQQGLLPCDYCHVCRQGCRYPCFSVQYFNIPYIIILLISEGCPESEWLHWDYFVSLWVPGSQISFLTATLWINYW